LSLTPLDDEQVKAVSAVADLLKTVVETARDATASVLGRLPGDLVSWAIGDRVAVARWENAERLFDKAKERLEARGVQDKAKLSASIAAPLLDSAADESRDELVELWSRLLANALDPKRAGRARLRFIEIVKKLEPLDARVLEQLHAGPSNPQPSQRDFFSQRLSVGADEVEVAFLSLFDLGVVSASGAAVTSTGRPVNLANVYLTAIGRQLLRAVEP
jgi:hypothetical protein